MHYTCFTTTLSYFHVCSIFDNKRSFDFGMNQYIACYSYLVLTTSHVLRNCQPTFELVYILQYA